MNFFLDASERVEVSVLWASFLCFLSQLTLRPFYSVMRTTRRRWR
jgi:hypothetical protein